MRYLCILALLILVSPVSAQSDASALGWLIPYVTLQPPTGCLPANGATYPRVDYPELYAALDLEFIVDADNFIVPDIRGRAPIGAGEGNTLTIRAVGETGGTETHTLTTDELPAHSHDTIGAGVAFAQTLLTPGGTSGFYLPADDPGVDLLTGETGTGAAHNNMMPFLAINWCVMATPIAGFVAGDTMIVAEIADQVVAFDYSVTAGDVGNAMILGFIAVFTSLHFLRRNEA